MRKAIVVARRELGSYFFSPMAYGIGALFLAVSSGLFFFGFPPFNVKPVFQPGAEASLRQLFMDLAYIMIFIAPLLTMRLMSEEYRSGTIEKLTTAPISEAAVIAGKFIGVMVFYAILLSPTLIFLALVGVYGRPDAGVAATGYLGMMLLGAAYLAVGLFASTLTRYQILAAVLSLGVLVMFSLLMRSIVTIAPDPLKAVVAALNPSIYMSSFAGGVFDTRGVIFFLGATAMFLFLSVKVLESRRWR